MKRAIALLLTILMLLSLLAANALADAEPAVEEAEEAVVTDGANSYAYDRWYAAAKKKAFQADHVIGPGGDVLGPNYYYVHYYVVIEPGETVAVLPEGHHPDFGIQGGYINSWYGNTIWQFSGSVANTDFLTHGSTPKKLALTEVETTTLTVPFADRLVDKPDDPAASHDGISEYTYVSLYRNDTGLPIVFDGGRGGEFGDQEDFYMNGKASGGATNFQGSLRVYSQPTLYFAEPQYDIIVDSAEIMTGSVNMEDVVWPDGSVLPKTIPVDNKDHTYTFPCPVTPNGWFESYNKDGSSLFSPGDGTRSGGVYTYTCNLQSKSREYTQPNLSDMLTDVHLRLHFGRGDTVRFNAQGGKLKGKSTLFVEVCRWNTDGFNINIGKYIPVLSGNIFRGWCTDPERPEETLITNTSPSANGDWHRSQHTELYAVWEADIQPGWQQNGNRWQYQNADGSYVKNAWQKVGGKWYRFDKSGYMQTGWQKIGKAWYYLGTDGAMRTGWQKIGKAWYYFQSSGAMATGWTKIGKAWYYFQSSGAMQTGWMQSESAWYYFQSSGAMATGWTKIGKAWYYFQSSGAMQTGWMQSGRTWYYFQSSGAMATGWTKIGSAWYYFQSSGAMQTGWMQSGKTWYYFQSSGAMATGWTKIGSAWYYFQSSGAMQTGWMKSGNTWYYFKSSGAMAAGETVNGYTFDASGAWVK